MGHSRWWASRAVGMGRAEAECAGQQQTLFRATRKYLGATVSSSPHLLSLGLLACSDLENNCSVAFVRSFSACIKCCGSEKKEKTAFLSDLGGHPRAVRQCRYTPWLRTPPVKEIFIACAPLQQKMKHCLLSTDLKIYDVLDLWYV